LSFCRDSGIMQIISNPVCDKYIHWCFHNIWSNLHAFLDKFSKTSLNLTRYCLDNHALPRLVRELYRKFGSPVDRPPILLFRFLSDVETSRSLIPTYLSPPSRLECCSDQHWKSHAGNTPLPCPSASIETLQPSPMPQRYPLIRRVVPLPRRTKNLFRTWRRSNVFSTISRWLWLRKFCTRI